MGAMKDIRLWGILVLALAVRTVMLFSVFADVERARTPDSEDYEKLGCSLASGGDYESDYALWGCRPEFFRTPGYPALLAGPQYLATRWRPWSVLSESSRRSPSSQSWTAILKSIISQSRSSPAALKIVVSFQVLLDLHLVLLTFLLGRALAGHGVGLMGALLQAFSPLAAAASCRILSDSIFAFMLIAAVVLLLRHFRTGGWWPLLSAALIMGAACYVRPLGLAFSAVMALVVLCSRRGTGILPVSCRAVSALPETEESTGETPVGLMGGTPMLRPRRVRRTLAFAAVVVGCVSPWVARNAIVVDYWGFSSFATDSIYWYSAAEIEARRQGLSADEIRGQFRRAEGWYGFDETFDERFWPSEPSWPYVDLRDRRMGWLAQARWDKAREIILAEPWQYAGIHLKGDAAFWLPGATDALEVMGYTSGGKGTLDVLHREGLVAAARHYFAGDTTAMVLAGAMVGILLVRYAGVVLCGLWRLRLRKMTAAGWLCVLLVLTACLLPGPANHPRFRVPVEPILSVAAAIGWLGLLEWRRRRRAGDKAISRDVVTTFAQNGP